MRKLSRFGAAALALALSVTFLTPVQVQAAKKENETRLSLKENLIDYGVIDRDKIVLGDFTGKKNGTVTAYKDVEVKMQSALIEKGLVTTTEPLDNNNDYYDGDTYFYDFTNYRTFKLNGTKYYTRFDWDDIDDSVADTVTVKGVYAYKFTNTQTKKSSVFVSEVYNNYTPDEAKARSFQSAIRVKKGEITYVAVPLSGGDTAITNVKSSKKSIAKVSIYKKMSYENNTNEDNVEIEEVYDETTEKYTWTVFYYTSVGAKVVVGTYDSKEKAEEAAKNAEMTASSAKRWIKVDAKKSGKTKLTFNIKNKNGNVSKVSTTIHVVDDTAIFNKLTYAGQSLIDDKDLEKKSVYAYTGRTFYTTKAKGKLVAKSNKNIVIKKIELGKLYTENVTKGLDDTDSDGKKYSDDYSAYSRTWKTTTHKADLNGDGDFDDKINGISESNVDFKFSKVKSGKTIKLSKIGEKYGSTESYTSKKWKNMKDEYESSSSTSKTRNFTAPTKLRITYYDKLLKTYGTTTYTIYLRVSK